MEIGSASFGLVVGLGRFKSELGEGRQVARREGDKIGDEITDAVSRGADRAGEAVGRKLTEGLKAAGATAGAALGVALWDSMNREVTTDRLAGQLGISPELAARAGGVAGDVYAQAWGESLGQVTDTVSSVMSTLGQFGVIGDEALESATIKAQALADTFGLDVDMAIANVGVLLRTGLASDADEAFDLITAAMQSVGPVARDEITDAIHEYSQFFAGIGMDGQQAFGVLVQAASGGTYAIDKAGDAIKEFQIRAQDGSAATTTAFETLGLDAERMGEAVAAGGEGAGVAFQRVIDGLLGIEDPALRAQTAVQLFGTPFEDIAGDGAQVEAILRSLASGGLDNVTGAAQELADTLGSNARTEVEAFGRDLRMKVADVIDNHVLPAIVNLPGPLDEMAMGLLAVGGQAGSLIGDLGPLGLALKGLGGGGAGGGALGGVTSSVGGLAGGFSAALPWIAAFAAAILIGYLIYEHWDEIKAFFGRFWHWLQDAFDAGWEWVKNLTGEALEWMVQAFLNWTLLGVIISHWDTIKNTAGAAFDWIVEKAIGFLAWFERLPAELREAGRGMWDWIGDSFRAVLNFLIRNWNSLDFKLPSYSGFEVGGVTIIPSWEGPTLGMPDIPYLAEGGISRSRGLAVVGDEGPELLDMVPGARITPLDRAGWSPGMAAASGADGDLVLVLDGQVLGRITLKRLQEMATQGGPLRLKVRG